MSISTLQETAQSVALKDEGVTVVSKTSSLDLAGAGVSATAVGNDVTATIPGPTAIALNDLNDTTITSPSSGQVLSYNGSAWVNSTETGLGTVTSVSIVSASGISGTVATSTTTPAITLTLGAITPSAVQVSGLTASEMVITDASKNLASAAVATYPSLTELTYVKGVTSALQTQLGLKAPLASPTFTGTVTIPTPFTIGAVSMTATAAELNILDGATLTVTELNYVDGVTSAIQTQIDGKSPTAGNASLVTVGTITSGVWSATDIALDAGGTNASLTASNGGIFYSTATAGAILAGTATAGLMLRSGATAAPTWSTPTFPNAATAGTVIRGDGTNLVLSTLTIPDTAAVSTILYASATNVISALATANSGVLVTSGTGVPSIATDIPTAVTIGAAYIYRVGGTDVAVADGGTGGSVASITLFNNITGFTAAGATGTTSTNLVFSTSPALTTPTVVTSIVGDATFAAFNTVTTTLNFAGAATILNIGANATCILNFGGSTTASEFRYLEPSGSGTNYSAFKAVAQAASITYSLPPAVGAAGTFLTDAAGDGVLTWAAAGGGQTLTGFSTIFEDVASSRYTFTSANTGARTQTTKGLSLETGATASSFAKLVLEVNSGIATALFDSLTSVLTMNTQRTTVGTDYQVFWGMGSLTTTATAITYTINQMGVKTTRAASGAVVGAATNADGTTETATTGITVWNATVTIIKTAATNIKFYTAGVLRATHTTNLPTASIGFQFSMSTTNADTATASTHDLSSLQFVMEPV